MIMDGRPVFDTKSDSDLWERAKDTEGFGDGHRAASEMISRVLSKPDPVHPAILCEAIRLAAETGPDDLPGMLRSLVVKKRHEDSSPALAAAAILARAGLPAEAQRIMGIVHGGPRGALYHLVNGIVDAAGGDAVGAENSYLRAVAGDPTDPRAYGLLDETDPSHGWPAELACERMAAGLGWEAPPKSKSSRQALFEIYREWYEGDRDVASGMLISSPGYADRKPAFCLLSARMSRDEGDWSSAVNMYDRVVEMIQDSPSLFCERGDALLHRGETEAAMDSYRSAEALDQTSPSVMRGLISCSLALGRTGDAVQMTRDFLDSESALDTDYARASVEMIRIGRVREATEFAKALLASRPGDTGAKIVLSKAAMAEGNLSSAESVAKGAVRHDRGNPEALAQLARVRLARGRLSKAIRTARKAVKADPDSLAALLSLVDACIESGDVAETEKVCDEVLGRYPGNRKATETLARIRLSSNDPGAPLPEVAGAEEFISLVNGLVRDGRHSDALRLCDENEDRFGTVPSVRILRGNAQYALGDYLSASASYASAAASVPERAEVWHSKGMADEALGDFDSAEESYRRAVAIDMCRPDYWTSLGIARASNGRSKGAVDAFNRAIELEPRSVYPLVRKAVVLANESRYPEALGLMDLASAAEPDSVPVMKARMRICLAAGRYNDVGIVGRVLRKKGEEDPETVALTVRADMRLGDTASAMKTMENALAKDGESPELLLVSRDLASEMGDSEGVVTACRAILKQHPDDRRTRRMLGDALRDCGRGEEADEVHKELENSSDADTGSVVRQDAGVSMEIARSLLDAGDLSGAARMADRVLAVDPDDPGFVLFRTEVYRRREGAVMASAFISDAIGRNPTEACLHEVAGDLASEIGNPASAAASYGKAIGLGSGSAELHLKRGMASEAAGDRKNAARSYEAATMLDSGSVEASMRLASMRLALHEPDSAIRAAERSIALEPHAGAYAVMASACQEKRDREGVYSAYEGLLGCDDATEEDTEAVAVALSSVGLRREASSLRGMASSDRGEAASPEVQRCAERLMRRAYMLGADIGDPDLAAAMSDDEGLVEEAVGYLEGIPEYGEVIFGTKEQSRLESLSYSAVKRGKVPELEAVTVDAAYVAGGARDAEEARLLTSYIRAAARAEPPREVPARYRAMAEKTSRGDSIEDVMLRNGIGVYGARIVRSCLGSSSSRTS